MSTAQPVMASPSSNSLAQRLEASTPAILACLHQGGSACMNTVFLMNEIGGGAISPLGGDPTITAHAAGASRSTTSTFLPGLNVKIDVS
jgi:hypothetical protein